MNKRLYKLMDWAFIEEVIYSECSHPQDLLGPHAKGQTVLLQAYFPGAQSVVVKWKDRGEPGKPSETEMEVADDDGFFAQLLPTKDPGVYTYVVTYEERQAGGKTLKKKVLRCGDPYRHTSLLSDKDIARFTEGKCLNASDILGSHYMEHDGEEGTLFAVYAPNAMRISVVGDFNSWDGRLDQMCKREDSGIFELFIPGIKPGEKYQYEIKFKNYDIIRKADPYATELLMENGFVSVVPDNTKSKCLPLYSQKSVDKNSALSIYQINPFEYVNEESSAFAKMCEIIPGICRNSGFTHVNIGNVLTSSGSRREKCISFYAIDKRLGSSEELKAFVNTLHDAHIGVIFDWVPSYFAHEEGGLALFDGTGLYEHIDPRQGYAADIDACLFNYASNTVSNFLLSSGFKYADDFGADGIRVCGIARMLYLDYSKTEWVPNIYGGNENLDAISFLKDFNTLMRSKYPGMLLIAEDSSLHQGITDPVCDNGLGFDYKWNEVFYDDFIDFIRMDPLFRGRNLHLLPDELTYAFVEDFVLPFAGREKTGEIGKLYDLLPGDDAMKKAQMRLSAGYLYSHPGKKAVGAADEICGKILNDLNELYETEPALRTGENDPANFEWLSNMNEDQACVSFVRKTDDPEDMLVFIVNFSGIEQSFQTGVPYEGKYKEIFTTDDKAYGGSSSVSKTVRKATDKRMDGRTQSISVKIRPLSMIIMKFIPYTEAELEKVIEQRIRNYTPIKKSKK